MMVSQSSYMYMYVVNSCMCFSYTRVVAHYPYVVLAAVLLVSVTCLIVTVVIGDAPSFKDPLAVCISFSKYKSLELGNVLKFGLLLGSPRFGVGKNEILTCSSPTSGLKAINFFHAQLS